MSQSSQNSPLPGKPVLSYFQWLYAFWKFSRPHTIIGTSLSVLGLYLIAIAISRDAINHISTDAMNRVSTNAMNRVSTNAMNRVSTNAMNLVSTYSLLPVFGAWIGCLCGNVYIVGLNQLEDVEIDKINKPHLPLASGEFSQQTGQLIVALTGILALAVAWLTGPFLLGMVAISLAIGTAYSLPPIRLKQFPVWAALCIFSVRGTIVNLGLYLHYSWALQQSQTIPLVVWVLTLFILVFTFAIAIFKDIPDMEGDRLYNITTFTIKLGPQAVFNLSLWVITACYLGIILIGVLNVASVNAIFLVITHLGLLAWLWLRSLTVDLRDKSAIAQFYQFIWKLFFIEYLIFPIACLLA